MFRGIILVIQYLREYSWVKTGVVNRVYVNDKSWKQVRGDVK